MLWVHSSLTCLADRTSALLRHSLPYTMWHYDRFWYKSLETSKIKNQEIKNLIKKVNIFWEGHNILWNLHLTFDYSIYTIQSKVRWRCGLLRIYELYNAITKVRWRFRKILWPSQNIWTLAIGFSMENGKSEFAVKNAFVSFLHHISNSKQNCKTIFIQKRRNSNSMKSTS